MKLILITLASYLFCDDPTPNPEFDNLTFIGRFNYFKNQLDE